jgi:hypothetical protein
MHTPLLAETQQVDAGGWKRLLDPHICPTRALALDPGAVPLDK